MSLRIQRRVGATMGALLLLAGCSPLQEIVTPRSSSVGPVMLSRTHEPNAFMEALFVGRVIEDAQGCLRLDSADRHTVIWPAGFSLAVRGGSSTVLDAAGSEVGAIGASFRLGGGEVTQVPAHMLTTADAELAAARCPGRYWLAWISAS